MRKVLLFSLLLIGGLVVSQFIGDFAATPIRLLTMIALSFIMVHVGWEFEIDKNRPLQYLWDYVVAGTAAAFPWILCALYFVFVMAPRELWGHADLWKETLLEARFSSPTSAGVLFSMLAAAGLSATWVFKKARILAIFDDLDTILLMIPLKMLIVGNRWQLWIIVLVIVVLLMLAWRYLHVVRWPVSWPWVLVYSVVIVAVAEMIHLASMSIDRDVPIHLEVLLPAFVLGCMLARRPGEDPHADDPRNGHQEAPPDPQEQRVATIVSACFMVLVGLSMPPMQVGDHGVDKKITALAYAGVAPQVLEQKARYPGWGMMAVHVLAITLLSNLGKMFPATCYRREASWRERLAVAIGMFPRGEVGAGVLVISLSYGLAGPALTVAVLSLALNLLLTGVFIAVVKALIAVPEHHKTPCDSLSQPAARAR